jgi:hypothetical protein
MSSHDEKNLRISFDTEKAPANVLIAPSPLKVSMSLSPTPVVPGQPREPIPVCISLCEPICANCQCTIGIRILGIPIATITMKCQSRIHNCEEQTNDAPTDADA